MHAAEGGRAVIHWTKRPVVLVVLLALLIVLAALGDAIHWSASFAQ